MARKYFTLVQRIDGEWSPQFGDYDRQVVADESDSYWNQGMGVKRKDLKIITTGPKQSDIAAKIDELNGKTVKAGYHINLPLPEGDVANRSNTAYDMLGVLREVLMKSQDPDVRTVLIDLITLLRNMGMARP